MKKQTIVIVILLFTIFIFFLFFLLNHRSNEISVASKVEEEAKYVEERIIGMMNQLNQINLQNYVLVEEKTKDTQNEEQDGNSQSDNSQGGSSNSSKEDSSSSSGGSSGSENKQDESSSVTTKYKLKNAGILSKSSSEIDWKSIKSEVEDMYSMWSTMILDLHQANVNNEDILNFTQVLDQVTVSIKQEDKKATLNNLASLYAFVPTYLEQVSEDKQKINIAYTKACVLNTYALVEQEKWEEMKTQMTSSIQYFSNVMNSTEEKNQNQNQISKIYVLLNEVNNSIDKKEKDLFYIKYRNAIQELIVA